jgi:DNA-binding response OmpR family regulator
MSGMKILCVEDHPEYLAILTCALEGIGYEVMPASNEGQAIHLMTKQPINGVLLEDNLPDVDGSLLRKKLKAIRPDIPVLMFAGVGKQTTFMLRFFDAYLRNVDSTLGDAEL